MRQWWLAVVLLAPGAAVAQEVAWQARMLCDGMPNAPTPLVQQITLVQNGGNLRYERQIMLPQGGLSPYSESGTGTIGRDGAIVLTGGASTRTYSYQARYEGRMAADGRGVLTGSQHWGGGVNHVRPCRIEFRRGS
jgi:hypothetical protein